MTTVKVRDKTHETKPPLGRAWTSRDIAELRRLAPLGVHAVAEILDRSPGSVRQQARRQRISLRRPGERRGLILGQPRGVRFVDRDPLRALRDDVLAGDADPARIDRRLRMVAMGAPLCPACTRRPQEISATGLCLDCHLKGLAEHHRLEQEVAAAQRELDRERQRKHRRRKREGAT